jgi:tetratricopeptide (TPR) repeat protein
MGFILFLKFKGRIGMANPQEPQVDEVFAERYRATMADWQSGGISASDAEQELMALGKEAEDEGNRLHRGAVELNLGIIQGYLANFTRSAHHFENARQDLESVGAISQMLTCDLNIGEVYRLQGNFARAQIFFHRAFMEAKNIDHKRTMAVALTNEGQMWISMGSPNKAYDMLHEALSIASQPYSDEDDERVHLARLGVLAEIYHALTQISLANGDTIKAWSYAKNSYENANLTQHPMRMGYGNRAVADAITALGDAPEPSFDHDPDTYYKQAMDYFRAVHMEGDVAKTMFARGKSLVRRGKKASAAKLFQQALVIFEKLGMRDDAAKAAEAQMHATAG